MPPFGLKTPQGGGTKKASPGLELGPNWINSCIRGFYLITTSMIFILRWPPWVKDARVLKNT